MAASGRNLGRVHLFLMELALSGRIYLNVGERLRQF